MSHRAGTPRFSPEYYRERPAVSLTAGRSYVSDARERDFLYEECKESEQEHKACPDYLMRSISLLVEETVAGTEYEKQCVKGLAHIPVPEEESGKDPVDPVDYSQPEEEIPEVAKHSITLYHTNSKDYITRQISELFQGLCP